MMQTVYDKDGKAYEVDSVDAREYIAMGEYFSSKPGKEEAEAKPEKPAAVKKVIK
jgi:hypothetical protein